MSHAPYRPEKQDGRKAGSRNDPREKGSLKATAQFIGRSTIFIENGDDHATNRFMGRRPHMLRCNAPAHISGKKQAKAASADGFTQTTA
jgi:hypothetical protein